MKKSNIFVFSILSGLLLGLSFPPLPFNLLAFVGLVPILFIFLQDDIKHKYLYLYIAFFLYHCIANWWIGSWQSDTDPYLTASAIALAIIHPFYFFIPFVALRRTITRSNAKTALSLFPAFWVSFEWLHSLGEASYPWLTLGNTQIQNSYWVQFVDITGVWGASFFVVLFNVLILKSIDIYVKTDRKDFIFKNKLNIALMLLIIVVPVIYSNISINLWKTRYINYKKENMVSVGIVQPAINPWRKWDTSPEKQIAHQLSMQDSLLKITSDIDMMLWSETSIPIKINYEDKYDYSYLQSWVDSNKVSILSGFAEVQFFTKNKPAPLTARYIGTDSSIRYEAYNAAMIVNPDSKSNSRYRKMKLTPFAERLPYSEELLFMRSWFEWGVGISAWGIGRKQTLLELDNNKKAKIGPIICIESIYPEFVSDFAKLGANIFVIITNDAWYDHTPGPKQHYLIAAMRAMENRRFIVRCANTGISGLISSWGESLSELPQYRSAAMVVRAPKIDELTIYTRYGAWLPKVLTLISLIFLIYIYFIYKKK